MNGLQQLQMESCQPIKRLRDKKKIILPSTGRSLSGYFPKVSTLKLRMEFSFSHSCTMPCPYHFFDMITQMIFGEDYRSLSSSLCSFLHSPVTSSLLGPNILNTLLSNTLSLRSSLNLSNQVSHPYKTTVNIIVLYILIFIFLDSKLDDKRFCTEKWQTFPDFS